MTLFGIELSLDFLEPIIRQWGYLIVFVLAFLETSALVGLLVPGETTVLLAAALASRGFLDPYWLALVVCSGAILGDSVGYFLGRRVGRDFILRHPRLFRISEHRLAQADGYFARHGGKTIFFGRWIGFLRSLAPLLAGSAHMSYPKFLFYDVAGAISWGVTLTALGYVFGRSLSVVEQWLGRLTLFLVIFFVVVIGMALLARWLRSKGAAIGALAAALADKILSWRVTRAIDARFHRELAWLARRFSPQQAFGLGLTLGLVTSAALLYLFVLIASAVLQRTPLVRVDGLVADELHERAFASLTFLAEVVSFFTASWATIVISLLVGVAIYLWRRLRLDALVLLASAVGAGTLAAVLKVLIQRPRPTFAETLAGATGYSFPSGHVTSSTAFYLALALLATGWVRRWETRVYILLGLVILLLTVGFSRLYLGAHYLTDVLGGYAAGAFWAAICITGGAVLARAQAAHHPGSGGPGPDQSPPTPPAERDGGAPDSGESLVQGRREGGRAPAHPPS